MPKYFHGVLLRNATFDVQDFRKVYGLLKNSDEDYVIQYIGDDGASHGENFNPAVKNFYILGVVDG